MRISNAAVGLVCFSGTTSLLKESNAFIPKRSIQRQRQHDCSLKMALTPEEERAAALSEYLAKAHEEKLRAVREVEDKKSKEIQELKQQVEELKSSGASGGALTTAAAAAGAVTTTPANMDLNEMTKEQLINKIFQHQEFMQDYIVKSHDQKIKAVAAAQKDVNLKWEQKLLLAGGVNGATAVDPTTTSSPAKKDPPAEQSSLYASRNAKVSAAAAAGKSRWNDMENKKVESLAGAKHNGAKAPAAPQNDAKPPPASAPVPPEVEAADHGMRADGGVGGLTLAERVAMGSEAEAAAATPAKVVPVPPEVLAADHGMRADGGVGGLTLAERVAFGAEAGAQAATSASELEVRHDDDSLYQLRSMHVAKAAAAGKSRWGGMENKKCEDLASSASTSLTAAAGRVNVGASIVGQ